LLSLKEIMIYADYNGSSPLLPSVKEYLIKRLDSDLFGNPNAIHSVGSKLNFGIEKSREIIAKNLGCYPDQIIFNSGSSEGVATIFHSLLSEEKQKKVIIASPIEHAIVNLCLENYEKKGFEIVKLKINLDGVIDLADLKNILQTRSTEIAMVSIMAANNETGVLQPFKEIGTLTTEFNVPFFSDTTQIITKSDFHFEESGIDFGVCSGHKLGALTGTGFILVRDPSIIKPLIFSKTQEKYLRGGTQNYLGIETMAVALNEFQKHKNSLKHLKDARLRFEEKLITAFPNLKIIGFESERLPGTTLVGYPGIHGQAVQIELESQNIFVTTSAACADNQPETSDALKALGVQDTVGRSVIRISLSYHQGEEEYAQIARSLENAYNKLKKIYSY